ncbi:protein GbcA [Pseudomonas fulva]|nr:protein GbcA [Pseudomonas fulva]
MGRIMLKPGTAYIPVRDIGVLIATSLARQGLARRERIRPCRPWIWIAQAANAHSTANEHAV